MKKSILSLFVLGLFVLSMMSCGKTCDCVTSSNISGSSDVTTTIDINKGKCSDSDSEISSGGITTTTTCKKQ